MTIKETAGKVLLYFYQLQRIAPLSMRHRQVGFLTKKDGGVSLTSDKKWLTANLLDINPGSTDVFNAFSYLLEKGYLRSNERASAEARVHVGIALTAQGIDVVETIEQGTEGRQLFQQAFNIDVSNRTTVEAVIGDHLKAIVGDK